MKSGMFGALVVMLACTKETPPPEPVPGPDVVAIVLGRWITRDELGTQPLENLVNPPLFARFVKENGITATEQEVLGFMQSLRGARDELTKDDPEFSDAAGIEESFRKVAEDAVLGWKIDRKLYEMYGGDVIFQQADPFEPVGAERKFLEGEERAGRFKILDPSLVEPFWDYYRRKQRGVYDPSEVDYSVPWWAKKR